MKAYKHLNEAEKIAMAESIKHQDLPLYLYQLDDDTNNSSSYLITKSDEFSDSYEYIAYNGELIGIYCNGIFEE